MEKEKVYQKVDIENALLKQKITELENRISELESYFKIDDLQKKIKRKFIYDQNRKVAYISE